MGCACGGGQAKAQWRITYPNGSQITTSNSATKAMAEAAGAKVEQLGGKP